MRNKEADGDEKHDVDDYRRFWENASGDEDESSKRPGRVEEDDLFADAAKGAKTAGLSSRRVGPVGSGNSAEPGSRRAGYAEADTDPRETPRIGSDEDCEAEHEEKRMMKDLGQLTKEEIKEHNIDHTSYRSWCSSCVKAREKVLPTEPDEILKKCKCLVLIISNS